MFDRVVYSSGQSVSTDLYTIRTDGSHLKRLTHDDAGVGQAEYSPDGRHIVGVVNSRITMMRGDGSHAHTVVDPGSAFDFNPDFSPNGRWIAFERSYDSLPKDEIYVVRTDGTGLHRIDNSPGYDDAPTFSPRGGLIAFMSDRGRANGSEIWVMRADGSHVKRLTHDAPDAAASFPTWEARPK